MNLGLAELLIVILFALPLWGIIDAALRPDSQWVAAGQNKVAWILVQLFLGTIGAAVYLLAIRPKLKAVASE